MKYRLPLEASLGVLVFVVAALLPIAFSTNPAVSAVDAARDPATTARRTPFTNQARPPLELLEDGLAPNNDPPIAEYQCPNIDMSSDFGRVRTQGSTGTCYAFAATDLLGYQQGLRPPEQFSVFDFAINFVATEPESWNTPEMIDYHTIGDSQWVPAAARYNRRVIDRQRLQSPEMTPWDLIDEGGRPEQAFLAYAVGPGACMEDRWPSQDSQPYENQVYMERVMARDHTAFLREFGLSPSARLSATLNSASVDHLRETANQACGERRQLRPFRVFYSRTTRGTSQASRFVAQSLRSGIPMGISYDRGFLTEPGAPQRRHGHDSPIVGARWNRSANNGFGRCEFKMRNSTGPVCYRYHASVQPRCVAGHVWLTEQELNERVAAVYSVR